MLGLEDRSSGLPMLLMAEGASSLDVVDEVDFLAMMRGFFFFLGFMPIITLPLLDILLLLIAEIAGVLLWKGSDIKD